MRAVGESADHKLQRRHDALAAGLTPELCLDTLDRLLEGCQVIGHDYRYLYVNDAVTRQGRKSRSELVGHLMPEVYPGIERTAIFESINRVLRGGAAEHLETEFEFADGSRRWFELSVQPVPEGAFILSIDITERIAVQRLSSRSQRLESLGTLAGGVAHDLNNSLAPILLSIGMLREDGGSDRELLDSVEESAGRAVRLVRQLITFAKGADGQRVPVAPGDLLREMQRLVERSFPKAIKPQFRVGADLPQIVGDPTQIHQVLLNLCINARDAMPDGGSLIVEADVMDVDETYASAVLDGRAGRFITIAVRDSGTGIAAETIDRIFEPFFTTKGPELGTGLGLSTSLGIVRGHGGFLHVYSEVGRGTTFRVFLPVSAESAVEGLVTGGETLVGHGRKILIVDDDARLRQAAATVLSRLGFEPLTAVDGADALLRVAEHLETIAAVVLDLQMPRMDGAVCYARLREILPHVPVVVASGRPYDPDEARLLAGPEASRLAKPFTQPEFIRAVRGALGEAP